MTNRERAAEVVDRWDGRIEGVVTHPQQALLESMIADAMDEVYLQGLAWAADYCALFAKERRENAQEGHQHGSILLCESSGARLCELAIRAKIDRAAPAQHAEQKTD